MAEQNPLVLVAELHDADGAADYILLNPLGLPVNLVRWNPATQPDINWGDGITAVLATDTLRAFYAATLS